MIVVHGTVGVVPVRALARSAAEFDVLVLDAPVSGGERGVAEGALVAFAGGEQRSLDRAIDVSSV